MTSSFRSQHPHPEGSRAHMDDVQLSMYVEGDVDDSVRIHIEQCAVCQERARVIAAEQEHLRALLRRSTCPPPDELRDYAWDLLADDEAQSIARHLSYCPHCTAEYFRDYYAGDTSGEDLFTVAARSHPEGLRSHGSRIRFHEAVRMEMGMGQAAALRDADRPAGQVAIFRGGESVLLLLHVLADEIRVGRFVIEGSVSGMEAGGLQVNLWQDQRPVQTVVLDRAGDFRIAGLADGSYELILNGPTYKLRIPQVRVGTTAPTLGEPGAERPPS